jgi:carbon-monoxide dehydrogenase small subunit
LSSENSNSETITGKRLLRLRVNGELHEVAGHVTHSLLEVLREEMGLTGTKHGCELGECGTCTVLVDGEPIYSCLMLAVEAEGPEITTVEGLALPGRPHPLQRAFSDLSAAQCGYCIPGILLAAKSLLDKQPDPSRGDIEEGLSGNLCRCTGYTKIIEAVERAVREMQGCRIQGAEGRST